MDIAILLLILLWGGVALGTFLAVLYIFFTSGFKNTGRLTGGLYTIRGKPGDGKSYFVTSLAVEALKEGKRKVFSNYPIIYNDGIRVLSSLFFDPSMILDKNLNGSVVIHDESHQDNFSRDYKNFDKKKMAFYSRCSQHGISYYSVVQHENRQDTIINDCSNLFAQVEKLEIPFLEIPIYFMITWFSSEEDLKKYMDGKEVEVFHYERVWFNKEVANSYNTRFFGVDKRPLFEGTSWIKHNHTIGIFEEPSDDFSNITKIRLKFIKKVLNPISALLYSMGKKARYAFMSEQGRKNDESLEKEFEEYQKRKGEKDGLEKDSPK